MPERHPKRAAGSCSRLLGSGLLHTTVCQRYRDCPHDEIRNDQVQRTREEDKQYIAASEQPEEPVRPTQCGTVEDGPSEEGSPNSARHERAATKRGWCGCEQRVGETAG